jgi:hypothetical protein
LQSVMRLAMGSLLQLVSSVQPDEQLMDLTENTSRQMQQSTLVTVVELF